LFIAVVSVLAPGFMNPQQEFFMLALVIVSGLALASALPRLLPRAERMMQERMFRTRYGYQDALAGMVKDLSRLPNLDLLVWTVANTIHTQMQVSRVIVFLQDALSGDFRMSTQSGLNPREASDVRDLRERSAVVRWLQEAKDVLSRDELPQRLPAAVLRDIEAELKPLKVAVCVPMMLEDRLVGLMGIGEKLNKDMFFISDLKLLETLATEVAMAVKYRRMEEEMFHKNKLAELGAIAAGVAHEIRNPLSSIRTFAQLLPHRVDDPEFKYEFSKMVLKDVDRITKVVESMLTFARPARVTIGDYPASELVEESILLVQPRLTNKHIKLTKHYHEQPVLKVDKQQIVQVLVNLLNNASDVLMEGGKIHVAVGVETSYSASHDGADKMAVIEVADNGPGIPTAIRGRVFDPFFTTKKEGTGLGLSISQKILRDHGGIITLSSVEGKGTSFQVRLPLH